MSEDCHDSNNAEEELTPLTEEQKWPYVHCMERMTAKRDVQIAALASEVAHWKAECDAYVTLSKTLNEQVKSLTSEPIERITDAEHATALDDIFAAQVKGLEDEAKRFEAAALFLSQKLTIARGLLLEAFDNRGACLNPIYGKIEAFLGAKK